MTEAQLRRRLSIIGARRERHREEAKKLQEETEQVVKEVRSSPVSMQDAAKLLKLNRATLYETYGADGATDAA